MAKQERKEQPKVTKKRLVPKILERDDRNIVKGRTSPKNGESFEKPVRTRHHVQGILFGAVTILLFVSLITQQAPTQNIAGIIGNLVAEFFFTYFGYIAYVFPIITLCLTIDKFRVTPLFLNYSNGLGAFLGVLALCALFSLPFLGQATIFSPGGFVGVAVAAFLVSYLNTFGSVIVIMTGLVTAGILLKTALVAQLLKRKSFIIQEDEREKIPQILPLPGQNQPADQSKTLTARIARTFKRARLPGETNLEGGSSKVGYQLPPLTLLNKPHAAKTRIGLEQDLLNNSRILTEKLLDFGIEGLVVGVLPGPVITRYEFQPAPGIKVSRIVNLADDLALAMKAIAVRIVAPVPGKDVIGIEVPNETKEVVYLREILESKSFGDHSSKIAIGVGKDIGGRPYVADLAKMPHLLIAGATGSGKSVCLNSLICSILFHATPDEVRFIMVDPKMLELGVYDGIPHLLIPVVKNPEYAANALNWATEEMTRRYGILAQKGVRNIAQYNEAILELQQNQAPDTPHGIASLEKTLPYIVVIVDELADLMIVSVGVEKPITRLAQMARAVGIHLILATQRPSVDVITGVIKANFPARVSFRVASKVDSRTILDANGAELLLGDGDMLFLLPGTSHLRRLHGSFVTEKEIKRLTTALKKMGQPHYDEEVLRYSEGKNTETEENEEENLYEKAVRLVVTSGEASVSMLRRALNIGHSRASRMIDSMEKDGIVGKFNGTRPRDILLKPEQLDERFRSK
jgi:S-DNA-T family DNA segregation ATPase FtsK/SpoIIIE